MPTLIPSLKLMNCSASAGGDINGSLEFGNVLIYTCYKSCWEDGKDYKREQIYLEAEAAF